MAVFLWLGCQLSGRWRERRASGGRVMDASSTLQQESPGEGFPMEWLSGNLSKCRWLPLAGQLAGKGVEANR